MSSSKEVLWDGYVNQVLTRFSDLWQSKARSLRRKHLKRAWRYIFTGDASASIADERVALSKAMLSSPELLAFIAILIAALGSACLYLLQIPLVLTDPKSERHQTTIVGFLHAILRQEDSALRFVLVSAFALIIFSFLMSAVAYAEVNRISKAKAPLCKIAPSLERVYYAYMEEKNTHWYTVIDSVVPKLARTAFSIIESPLVLLLYILLSSLYLSLCKGIQVIFAFVAFVLTIKLAWRHCWSRITPFDANGRQSDDNCFIAAYINRMRLWLAGLNGLQVSNALVMSECVAIWLFKTRQMPPIILTQAQMNLFVDCNYSILAAYSLYQALWSASVQRPFSLMLYLLSIEGRMRANQEESVREDIYENHSFSVWCRRLAWQRCYSLMHSVLRFEFLYFILCYLGTY